MPAVTRAGGVSQYFRSLRPHWRCQADYFTVGSRSDSEPPIIATLRLARDTWKFCCRLASGRYDVVHLNPSIGSKAALRDAVLLLLAKASRKPAVVFAHGWYDDFERRLRDSTLCAWVLNRADAFIVLGETFAQRLRLLGYQGRAFLASVPVDDLLLRDAASAESCAHRNFTILFLARVVRTKGIYEALEAYRILQSKYPWVRLTVAGDGADLAAVRVRAAEIPGVAFTGHVEGIEKSEAFRQADVYLFPSHSEGLPTSVLEAMAYGLPVVTSNVGALPDFFQDGSMGFMCGTRDPEALASLIEKLILDPELTAEIRLFNRNYAANRFTGSRIARDLEFVYQAILEKPGGGVLHAQRSFDLRSVRHLENTGRSESEDAL